VGESIDWDAIIGAVGGADGTIGDVGGRSGCGIRSGLKNIRYHVV
jgi:hypothetical protein